MTTATKIKSSAHVRPYLLQVISAIFIVYETVLATLAGTHLAPPGSLDCALREQWLALFRAKDGSAIRAIQDRFECCGLGSTVDMAWPFPGAGHDAATCIAKYERTMRCLEPWRESERTVAGLLLAVALGVFVWQVRSRILKVMTHN